MLRKNKNKTVFIFAKGKSENCFVLAFPKRVSSLIFISFHSSYMG